MLLIDRFDKDYKFLSNFWPCRIIWDSLEFPSVENAYQARKTDDPNIRWRFTQFSPGAAKRRASELILPANWAEIKYLHMLALVQQKFQHPGMMRLLLGTGQAMLVEGNQWGDTYWGVCNGQGENKLGKILMQVRDGLR